MENVGNCLFYCLVLILSLIKPSQTINRLFACKVKVAILIFISGRGSAISSAKEGKSGSIYD